MTYTRPRVATLFGSRRRDQRNRDGGVAMNEIGVAYVPGESFYASEPRVDTLRLSYSQMTEGKIGEGIGRLGRLLKEARS